MNRWRRLIPLLASVLAIACGAPALRTPIGGPVRDTQSPETFPLRNDSVRFAVIGDTGTGGADQRRIAEQMTITRRRFPFEFVLMLGDNLYGNEEPDDYAGEVRASVRAVASRRHRVLRVPR